MWFAFENGHLCCNGGQYHRRNNSSRPKAAIERHLLTSGETRCVNCATRTRLVHRRDGQISCRACLQWRKRHSTDRPQWVWLRALEKASRPPKLPSCGSDPQPVYFRGDPDEMKELDFTTSIDTQYPEDLRAQFPLILRESNWVRLLVYAPQMTALLKHPMIFPCPL